MRIDVRKYLFVGLEKERFFQEAQEAGIIQFIDQHERTANEVPSEIQRLHAAIKVMRGLPVVEQEESEAFHKTDSLVDEVLELQNTLERLEEERRVLRQEIVRVETFGDFSLKDKEFIERESSRFIQFFYAKNSVEHNLDDERDCVYVGSAHGLDYYISISKERRTYKGLVEMQIERPLGALQKRQTEVQEELRQAESRLKALAKWNDFFHAALIDKMNQHNLHMAQGYVSLVVDEKVFSIEGWVPEHKMEHLADLLSRHAVHAEEVAIEEEDRVPTFLDNKGYSRIGEDLVHVYDTPSISDRDPSLWVLCSFAVFFALILNDAGYGLLFFLSALFLRKKFSSAEGAGKRAIRLFTILSVSCIVWGTLSNSFFGMQLGIDSSLRSMSAVQWVAETKAEYHLAAKDDVWQEWVVKFPQVEKAQNGREFLTLAASEKNGVVSYDALNKFQDNVMLELALLIGVIHIALSLIRYLDRSWAGAGWVIFMVGGYLYFPSMLNASSMSQYILGISSETATEVGLQLTGIGVGAAVLLALFQDKAAGAGEILNIIQVFSDVLSYLRLYALGLAGSMMSATFNEMGASMTPVLGIMVILVGHTINIILSIMGGVIHGLRLNFLEWYHYSFEGGGKMHSPLELIKVK